MRIAFVIKGSIATGVADPLSQGVTGEDPVWMKAKGLAERGHEVWVLSPESKNHADRHVVGVMHVGPVEARQSGHDGSLPVVLPWSAVAAGELLRLHQDHDIDIVDIPRDFTGICRYLSVAAGKLRLPAIVQFGCEPRGEAQIGDVRLPLYRFDGEISFSPSSPIESHIAILRLENFLHGVLNRHFAARQPAA